MTKDPGLPSQVEMWEAFGCRALDECGSYSRLATVIAWLHRASTAHLERSAPMR